MPRRILIGFIGFLCLVALVALASVIVGFVGGGASPERVYGVAAVRAGLDRSPRAWVGRTVLVRGWPQESMGAGCVRRPQRHQLMACQLTWLVLGSTPGPASFAALTVRLPRGADPDIPGAWAHASGQSDPLGALLALARSVPWIGAHLPPARPSGAYILRVRLSPQPTPGGTGWVQDGAVGP